MDPEPRRRMGIVDGVYTQNQANGTLSYAGSEAWTNYSVEADVRTPSGTSGTVMLVGRATDAGRYYGAWVNGTLSIQRRYNSGTSAKTLDSMKLDMAFSSTITGGSILSDRRSLYIDGELKLEHTDTDNAFPNGKIGFGTNKTKGFLTM